MLEGELFYYLVLLMKFLIFLETTLAVATQISIYMLAMKTYKACPWQKNNPDNSKTSDI